MKRKERKSPYFRELEPVWCWLVQSAEREAQLCALNLATVWRWRLSQHSNFSQFVRRILAQFSMCVWNKLDEVFIFIFFQNLFLKANFISLSTQPRLFLLHLQRGGFPPFAAPCSWPSLHSRQNFAAYTTSCIVTSRPLLLVHCFVTLSTKTHFLFSLTVHRRPRLEVSEYKHIDCKTMTPSGEMLSLVGPSTKTRQPTGGSSVPTPKWAKLHFNNVCL